MHNPLDDPVPNDPIQRIHEFARILAYGAVHEMWPPTFVVRVSGAGTTKFQGFGSENLTQLEKKWGETKFLRGLLVSFNYLTVLERDLYQISDKAFALLEQPAPASIFISYRRRDSSELALLILARFKLLGHEPYLDMNIEPGDDWETRLRHEVTGRDYFVSLVGPTTLASAYVRQEIEWALDAAKTIIPIWHRGFGDAQLAAYEQDYPELAPFFDKHAIRAEQENPIAYEGAIIQLLNRFGFTP